jgi:preprotein translocase subunit YajC
MGVDLAVNGNETVLALLQAAKPDYSFLFLVVVIFGIFYFVMIAPMRRRQKKLQQMIDDLKPGARVITNGGILGTVVEVSERVVKLRIADNVKVSFSKNAIAGLQESPEEETKTQ